MPRRVALRLFAFVDSMDEKKAVRDGRPIVRSIGQTFMPRPRDFFFSPGLTSSFLAFSKSTFLVIKVFLVRL